MFSNQALAQFNIRLKPELREWVAQEAMRNAASMNSEIVRAIVERRERVMIERGAVAAPVATKAQGVA